jgi:outer membrane protein assembly factor BamD (BamD/ComL family)
MKKFIIYVIGTLFIFSSCMNGKKSSYDKIKNLEKELMSKDAMPIDTVKAGNLVNMYMDYAKKYSDDSNAVRFLFKAANISMNINKAKLAIELFDRIMNDYPKFAKVADCLFLKAFVYDDKMKDYNKAREAYQAFLNKYPTHPFAESAKASIQNLGKTPDQLIRDFEAKQRQDSLAKKNI